VLDCSDEVTLHDMADGQAKFMRNRDRSLFAAMHLSSVVPKEDLIASILYCGPYDLKGLYDSKGWFARFFVRQIGLGLLRYSPLAGYSVRGAGSGY